MRELSEAEERLKGMIAIKRAYEPAEAADGFRVYVDRLWPRGLSHETFHYDLWDKDISPSAELRQWFHADPDGRWAEFARRYAAELRAGSALASLRQAIQDRPMVTLLYSSHDEAHNNATVLRAVLENTAADGVQL